MVKIRATLIGEKISSNSKQAVDTFSSQRLGEKLNEKIYYSLSEALYLVESKKMEIHDFKNKKLSKKETLKRFEKIDKKFKTKYIVFKDLRQRGYIVKTALKFGAEFRVYEKGKNPGKEHAKWILFPVSETQQMTWHDFSAKNRVSHSVKKNLLIAIVDEEGDVSYYEVSWKRP
jgi:tRNA-intron endonuclease, archaea type